jgi:hypothetical protein
LPWLRSFRQRGGNDEMKYAAPVVVDFGSISDHTFVHTNSQGHVVHKDHITCETDKFGEFSCGGHGGSVDS